MISALYRSLYWRIGLGFILCTAGVLTLQAVIVFALLNRTEAVGESLTQAASSALGLPILRQDFFRCSLGPPSSGSMWIHE